MSEMDINIKPLKILTTFENFLCVDRNLLLCDNPKKFVLIVHGILETLLIITNSILHALYRSNFIPESEKIYYLIASIYSLLQIILAFYSCAKYKQYIQYLNANHLQCNRNDNYRKKIKKLLKFVLFVPSFYIIMQSILFTYSRFSNYQTSMPMIPYLVDLVCHLNSVECNLRYNYEFLVLFCFLSVISEQLEFITESVKEFNVNERSVDQAQNFDKWCMLYTNIKNSSKLFNTIFGVQMTIMLATIILFYIIFLYSITKMSIMGRMSILGIIFYVLITGLMMFELIMLAHAAQRAQGSAETLRRRLALLTLNSLENGVYYKPAKDLLRVISTCPIETRAFGSIYVDMSLLPTCVVFFTYYTVIALQFNNIV